jgi:hypothetical protein
MYTNHCHRVFTQLQLTNISIYIILYFNIQKMIRIVTHTRPVQNVSSHFEYLEKRSRDLDVIWQPVRGDLTAHP